MRLALLFVALLATGPPDLSTGNVNGLTGVLYWPANLPNAKGEPQPLPSVENCEVRMVANSDLDHELRYPCGKWFVPPKEDRYDFWLEMNDRITPSPGMLVFVRKPFAGAGMGTIVPVTSAGWITVDHPPLESESVRVFSIESAHAWSTKVFERHVSVSPVRMPEGRVIVGRFDRKTNDAIALSRPIEVKAGATARVWPVPPVESDLLVVLSKPPELQRGKPMDAQLSLNDSTSKKSPDVLLNGFDRIIAIWYGVAARTGTVSLQSSAAFWEPQEVRFTRGKVTTIRSRVAPLPKVNVSINAPLEKSLRLEVARVAESEPLRQLNVQSGMHEVAELPAEPLRVALTLDQWKFTKIVDLSSGHDASVAFELQPIGVRGTVFHGDDAAPAEIAFRNGEEWVRVETNDRGEYETTFWSPEVHTIRISLKGKNQPPFLDAFREILHSGTVDFHVPRTDYTVRVRDTVTKYGIANARVMAGLLWTDESSNARHEAQPVFTDESGRAILPPLRKGELVVDVRAERYASREPLRMLVDERHHELEIDLQPLATAATLRLLLPGGAPAAHAEAWAFSEAMQPLWRGAADARGEIEVPDVAANALLLIRHASAASTIRRPASSETTWTLDAPAEPLTLVNDKKNAMVSVWLDGVKLFGPPLAFATWSTLATNPNGIWVGRNLPAKSLQVLFGPHDALAKRIDYPWAAPKN